MSYIEYQAGKRCRERHEAAAKDASREILRESEQLFREHLDWFLCDLRNEEQHASAEIETFKKTVDAALMKLNI